MNTNYATTFIPAQIPISGSPTLALTFGTNPTIQSQISPITHKDKIDQQVVFSHTPQRMQYSSSVDNLYSSHSPKDQTIITKYTFPYSGVPNGIQTSYLPTTSAIIKEHNYRLEQRESPYSKLNPLVTENNQILVTDLDLQTEREKNSRLERQSNELKQEISQLKRQQNTHEQFTYKTEEGIVNLDDLKSSDNFHLNVNVQQACSQFVLLCAENERLTYAYLHKEKEVVTLQNEILQLKSNVLLEQTKQSQFPFAQQLDIEAKLKVFEMRNESLHQQKLELQNKEIDYLQQIERLSQMNMLKEQQLTKMQNEGNMNNIQIQNLTEQINLVRKQYSDLKDTYEKQSSNLAQLDFQKLQSSQSAMLLTEKETTIFQKNQEIAECKNYIQILEKDILQLQERYKSESRNQLTITGKYDQIHQDLQEKYDNHVQLHNKLSEEFELTEKELTKVQGYCDLLLSENEKLSYTLKAKIEENDALKEEIKIQNTVQINYDESQTMINELKENIDKLLEDNKKLYEVNRQFTSQQDSQTNNIQNLEQGWAQKEKKYLQQISDLESKQLILNKQLQQKNYDESEYDLKNRNNEKTFKEQIYENEKLKSLVEIKDIKIKELQVQVEEMQYEYPQLLQTKQEYQLLIARSKELDKKMLNLQEECNSWKVKYSNIETHQTSAIEEMKFKVKNSCKDEYEREITWMQAKLEANESQKDQLMVKLASYEQKAIMNEHQLKDLKEKYANKTEDYDYLNKEYMDRKQKLETTEKQYFGMQEKHLLIRIENERLHQVLQQMQKECDEVKKSYDMSLNTNRKQHSEVYARMQEYEEINRNLKSLISEYQDEIGKLEKMNYNLKQSNYKIDEYENKILFLNREYEQLKLRLVESESQKQEFKIKFQESHNSLINYQQLDQQVAFLTKENERLQKLIMERCRQSNQFW